MQDVLVIMQESTVPMAFLRIKPIGVMEMLDQGCALSAASDVWVLSCDSVTVSSMRVIQVVKLSVRLTLLILPAHILYLVLRDGVRSLPVDGVQDVVVPCAGRRTIR
jgi:hypothetical protein